MATSSLLRIDMAHRSIYLAKSGGSRSQRTHFGIFISNAECDFITLSQDLKTRPCQGTIIHVIGEPLMMGYQLEIKRNYECNDSEDLKSLIFLGSTDVKNIHEPTSKASIQEDITRSTMEHQAATITPPPKGQSVRAPVDGVSDSYPRAWSWYG